jgi:ferredoxin
VAVCPVDCIYEFTGSDKSFPNQLYISANECIDCGACEPECPWEAIYEEAATPAVFSEDIPLNYAMDNRKDEFKVPQTETKPHPTPEQVAENKQKWGYS